jgi:hypothetical protein
MQTIPTRQHNLIYFYSFLANATVADMQVNLGAQIDPCQISEFLASLTKQLADKPLIRDI